MLVDGGYTPETLLAAGLILLSGLGERSSSSLTAVGLLTAGIGIGFTTSPITADALDGTARQNSGESSGLLNTSRAVGLSVGIAVMGALIAGGTDVLGAGSAARAAFVSGLSDALRVNAGIALAGALVALATINALRVPRRRHRAPELTAEPASGQASAGR